MKTLVIADDEPIIRMDLAEIFSENGYKVVGEASDGFDAVTLCRELKPDIVLMDIKMPLLDGLKASKIIKDEGFGTCVILVTSYFDNELVENAKEAGVMGYIIKPFDAKKIIPEVEVLVAKNEEIKGLLNDLKLTKEKLNDRKIIEKAKGKIMGIYGFTEDEAYAHMRKISMDKRCSLADVAKAFLVD